MGQRAQGNRPLDMGFTHRSRKDKFMVQVAAVFLFALAAGLGLTVILAMLKSNGAAILSALLGEGAFPRSEEHTSELQSLMRISYAVFCLKKKNNTKSNTKRHITTDQPPNHT